MLLPVGGAPFRRIERMRAARPSPVTQVPRIRCNVRWRPEAAKAAALLPREELEAVRGPTAGAQRPVSPAGGPEGAVRHRDDRGGWQG
jgi:hypothetical protein